MSRLPPAPAVVVTCSAMFLAGLVGALFGGLVFKAGEFLGELLRGER